MRWLLLIVVVAAPFHFSSLSSQRADAGTCSDYEELRPGYPGYQGYATGFVGIGDFGCIDQLERQHPSFSEKIEHHENLTAGHDLGFVGTSDLWTWEQWMQVEFYRTTSPIVCYYCAFQNAGSRQQPTGTGVDYTDVRLRCGAFGEYGLASTWAHENGMNLQWNIDDYSLRVIATLSFTNSNPNAAQLFDMEGQWMQSIMEGRGGQGLPNASLLWSKALQQGGYFPVPSNAVPEDQVWIMEITGYSLGFWNGELSQTTVMNSLKRFAQMWFDAINTNQTSQTFAEFIVANGAENWM